MVQVNQTSRIEVGTSGNLDRVDMLAPVPGPTLEAGHGPLRAGAKGMSALPSQYRLSRPQEPCPAEMLQTEAAECMGLLLDRS